MEWGKTLWDEGPDEKAVAWVVNELKWGRIEYDKNAGIQNITLWLERMERVGDTFRVKKLW